MLAAKKKYEWPLIIANIFFATSFLVVTVFQNLGIALNFFLLFLVFLAKNKLNSAKIKIMVEDAHVIFLFYFVFYISFVVVSFINMFVSGVSYIKFYPGIFGRMVNVTIFFVFFLFVINEKNRNNISTRTLLNAYLIGCYILLFFGIWQTLNFLFHIPYPNFYTRDHIHSIEEANLLSLFTRRVTSIAREPAFLVPYLIDAIIMIFYTSIYIFKKFFLIALFVGVLFFTLSFAGYMNMLLLISMMLVFARKTIKTLLAKIVFLLCSFFGVYLLQNVILSVFQRLNPQELFLSSRLQNSILSLRFMFSEASLFNILFGFGPRGFSYIRNYIFRPSGWQQGEMIDVTSHVIFVDFFVDFGIVGVSMIILLFCYLFMLSTKTYNSTGNRLGQVLCLNLVITSLYTADYASPRFTVIIILLLCLYKDARDRKIVATSI